ncbi:hypothetical protein [Paenibacillus endoradicis]|uniref:hypothetical protein n=1 Tax=Paenibacillus endoradicis TaxID=2972487 RepID=UPI002158DC4B|nr:hypothetical protein [Paenibacillus endoradicis]MCR8659100.1 hypothetical protein [Paenibacillus endoradicis]
MVGIKLKQGYVSGLVLSYEGRYVGNVTGLDNASKQLLQKVITEHPGVCPFEKLHPSLKKSNVAWLEIHFPCRVIALEFTDSGLLRQSKLLGFGV